MMKAIHARDIDPGNPFALLACLYTGWQHWRRLAQLRPGPYARGRADSLAVYIADLTGNGSNEDIENYLDDTFPRWRELADWPKGSTA